MASDAPDIGVQARPAHLVPAMPMGPIEAAGTLIEGIRLTLKEPTFRRQLVRRFITNGVAFLALLIGLIALAFWLTGLIFDESGWGAFFLWLSRLGLIAGLIAASPVIYTVLCDIIFPMIHAPVFKAARQHAGGPPVPATPGELAYDLKTVTYDIRRLLRLLAFTLALLPINLIPGLGSIIYFVAQLTISAHTMGWDILGRHFELHRLGYARQKVFLSRHRMHALAVGMVGVLLCMIPIAQLFFVTTNVVGAGILSARMDGAPRQLSDVSR